MSQKKFHISLRSKTKREPLVLFSDLLEKGYLEIGDLDCESDIDGLMVAKIYVGSPIFKTLYEDISKWSKTELLYLLKLIAVGSAELKQLEYYPHDLNVPDLSHEGRVFLEELIGKNLLDHEPR